MERHQLVPISATSYLPGLLSLGAAAVECGSVSDAEGCDGPG